MNEQALSRRSVCVTVATTLAVAVIVLVRVLRDGVQMHGCDGAPYIEHVARLETLRLWREGSLLSPWDLLVSMDGAFPPLMHLLTLPLGAIAGHEAEVALWSGMAWLLVLAASVGSVTHSLSGARLAAAAAFVGTMLLPAAHGFATRYYYDLPMTALIWASAAYLLRWRDRRPLRATCGAGVILAAAALVKWSALPFGLPVLAAVALCRRADAPPQPLRARAVAAVRLFAGVALLVGVTSLLFLWSSGADNSYNTMSAETFESSSAGVQLPAVLDSVLPGPVALVLRQAMGGLHLEAGSGLRFYSLRLVTSVYSPVLAALLAALCVLWLVLDRRAAALPVLVVLGHGFFLLLVLGLRDDRFLLVGALVPVVLASLGWLRCPAAVRTVLALLVVAVALGVALDFHVGRPASWNEPTEWRAPEGDGQPGVIRRGLGLASSVQRLGWVRADEQEISRFAYREALWQVVGRCRFGRIGELDGRPILGGCGNRFWWQYRGDLEATNGDGPGRLSFIGGSVWSVEDTGYGERGSNGPELLLLGDDPSGAVEQLPAVLQAEDWVALGRVSDPEARGGASLWARHDADPCDSRSQAQDSDAPVP
jgi:hypothetical protein